MGLLELYFSSFPKQFFFLLFPLYILVYKKLKKKKITTSQLALFSPIGSTGNNFLLKGGPTCSGTGGCLRGDVKIPIYKPHKNHKRSSVRSHTLAPTTICGLSHSLCWSPLTDLGHISSVTYVCHPLWFVCGHRKGILTSPLTCVCVCVFVNCVCVCKTPSSPPLPPPPFA